MLDAVAVLYLLYHSTTLASLEEDLMLLVISEDKASIGIVTILLHSAIVMNDLGEQAQGRVVVARATHRGDATHHLPREVTLIAEVLPIEALLLDDSSITIASKAVELVSLIAYRTQLALIVVEEMQTTICLRP